MSREQTESPNPPNSPELLVLGVGDAFSARYHPTSFLLTCDDYRLGIDCPDGYRRVLRSACEKAGQSIDLPDIDAFLLTHVHGDHMNGLEGAAFFRHFVERKKLVLHSTDEVRAAVWDERLVGAMRDIWNGETLDQKSFDDYFDFRRMDWNEANQVGPFSIEIRRTIHHVPTSALKIRAGGRTLGYSCDTAFDPALIDWLSECDLIIHETNFGPSHSDYARLSALPGELRGRMRLVHYPDVFDLSRSAIEPLHEGQVVRF